MIVSGRVVRANLNDAAFAEFTDVPLAPGGLRADEVEFAGDLDAETTANIRWFVTSRDDADETARRALAARRDDPDTCAGCVEVIGYLLGEA